MYSTLKGHFRSIAQDRMKNFHFPALLIFDLTTLYHLVDCQRPELTGQRDGFYIGIEHSLTFIYVFSLQKWGIMYLFDLLTASWFE